MSVLRVLAPLVLLADVCALGAIGVVVRRRTRGVRRGSRTGGGLSVGGWRTSRTTHLAWVGGAAAALWAVALGPPPAWVLGPSGVFVAASGLTLRVTRLDVDADALTVHYAARRPRRLRWDRCRAIRPPVGPLGAWRIEADDTAASLMPSDVFGHEGMLADAVRRTGLAFDRGTWRRPPPVVSPRR